MGTNEVKEICEMQRKIDSYEGFIAAVFMMLISKEDIKYPAFTGTEFDKEMNKIWKFVQGHIKK